LIVSTGWNNISINSDNITLQKKKLFKIKNKKAIFIRAYTRKINLSKNGKHHKLAPIQKAIFKQAVLALRKKTTIKIIAKAFGVSTRTIWKIKGKTKFFCKVNARKMAWSMSEWFNAYNMKQISDISINEIMNGVEPD